MSFHVGNKSLNVIREVLYNEVNEVYVCQDENCKLNNYYTFWKVKDHQLAKKIIEMLTEAEQKKLGNEYFAGKNFMGFLFPYEEERPLFRFFESNGNSRKEREIIYFAIVKSCMINEIPNPLCYLLMSQKQMQLNKDNVINFSYFVDLREFDSTIKEADCVNLCASLLLELMKKSEKKSDSYSLLKKKMEKQSYLQWNQLYKDLKISCRQQKKRNYLVLLKKKIAKNKNNLFYILLWVSCVFLILSLIMIISQMIFREIPFFRIFQNCFEQIGTQSLLQ